MSFQFSAFSLLYLFLFQRELQWGDRSEWLTALVFVEPRSVSAQLQPPLDLSSSAWTSYLCRILCSGDPGQLQPKHKQSGKTVAKCSPNNSCEKVAKLMLTCGTGWVHIGQAEWALGSLPVRQGNEKCCRLPSHSGEWRKALQHQCLIYNGTTSFLEPARHNILIPDTAFLLHIWILLLLIDLPLGPAAAPGFIPLVRVFPGWFELISHL